MSYTIEQRYELTHKRYMFREDAEAAAAILAPDYEVVIEDEGYVKYFRIVQKTVRPLFKGDLKAYSTPASALIDMKTCGAMSVEEQAELISKWRVAMKGWTGHLIPTPALDTVYITADWGNGRDVSVSYRSGRSADGEPAGHYIAQRHGAKYYRVFYHCGVYEWYVNEGRQPRHWYAKRGQLRCAYNARAAAWAKYL